MAKKIAILNFKGGVAKTTTAVNVCAAMALQGKKTLLVDLDGQCDSTFLLDFEVGDGTTIYDALTSEELDIPIEVYEYKKNFDFVAASTELDMAEQELPKLMMKENRLRTLLEPYEKAYDYIIIDCPPNNGVLAENALTAADDIIIPVTGDDFAMKGVTKIIQRFSKVKKMLNSNLNLMGFVFTMYEKTKIHKSAVLELERAYPGKVFGFKVRKDVRLKELPSIHKTIFDHAPSCNGAFDYMQLTKEIIKRSNAEIGN